MDESFRRAIRKMTGKSLVRFGGRPDRSQVMAQLAQGMQSSWTVVLHEHLVQAQKPQVGFLGETNLVSYHESGWDIAEKSYQGLKDELRQKLVDFRHKWKQRFQTEALAQQLLHSQTIKQDDQGYWVEVKGSTQEVRTLYFQTIHHLVGDGEKLLVTATSRALHQQEKLAQAWIRDTLRSPASRLLPSFEAGIRGMESHLLETLREGFQQMTLKRFQSGFKPVRGQIPHYPTTAAAVRSIGRAWNPAGAWESGFLALTEDLCNYLDGVVLMIPDWYSSKWALMLRGFSTGQTELFHTPDQHSRRSKGNT